MDRSSPDLWPDHIPGVGVNQNIYIICNIYNDLYSQVGQFLPATPYTDMADTPRGTGYLHNLSREEVETLMQLGGLNVTQLIGEVIIDISSKYLYRRHNPTTLQKNLHLNQKGVMNQLLASI